MSKNPKSFVNFSNRSNKYFSWLLVIMVIIVPAILGTCNYMEERSAMRNAIIIIGEVRAFELSRGPKIVDVVYTFNGQIINNTFGTYSADSLKINTKVKLKVSKKYPTKYIKFIGVYQSHDN